MHTVPLRRLPAVPRGERDGAAGVHHGSAQTAPAGAPRAGVRPVTPSTPPPHPLHTLGILDVHNVGN
eukprot:9491023-Pyramimonas_sp.AAC.1